jgi:hypothetical protein
MSMSLIALGDAAMGYVSGSLSRGLSLARRAQTVLTDMSTTALVPDGTSAERALVFDRGGLGRCDMAEVATLLSRQYPTGFVVVELPLRRSDDPAAPDEAIQTVTCGEEVYAACSFGLSLARVEATLRMTDPAFMYNAIVLESDNDAELSGCPMDWVDGGASIIRAVVIGAYDGEGFVVAE